VNFDQLDQDPARNGKLNERLILYTVWVPSEGLPDDRWWQLRTSVTTLRKHNNKIPVRVCVLGQLPHSVRTFLDRYGVEVFLMGEYVDVLALFSPDKHLAALSRDPHAHKWLPLGLIDAPESASILYVDTDTCFNEDIDRLFETYDRRGVWCREEPSSRRSYQKAEPEYLEEEKLQALAEKLGVRFFPPCNLGVVLFGHGSWMEIRKHLPIFLDYLWRFAVSLATEEERPCRLNTRKSPVVAYLRGAGADAITPDDLEKTLRFPSTNQGLLESHSFWLTLGHTTFEFGDFDRSHVVAHREFLFARGNWWLLHYYRQNTELVKRYLIAVAHSELADGGSAE
jgi:hypothetical protein